MSVFSTEAELNQIAKLVSQFYRLPQAADSIPGSTLEAILAEVRGGSVRRTYEFVDVVKSTPKGNLGWQVKSTKEDTPVTWKRAKLENVGDLVSSSKSGDLESAQELGNRVIQFCNTHAQESMKNHDLAEIGFSRLIVFKERALYYERLLCTRDEPLIFLPDEFTWRWSEPKKTKKKEQLPALHGISKRTGKKTFAWHGQGENQLHFSGEREWWPTTGNSHSREIDLTKVNKLKIADLVELLEKMP